MLSTWNQEVQQNFNLEGFQVSRSETGQSSRSQLMEGLYATLRNLELHLILNYWKIFKQEGNIRFTRFTVSIMKNHRKGAGWRLQDELGSYYKK